MAYEKLKTIKLLYVEDDESVMEVFSRGMRRKVSKLYTAKDGKEGYEQYLEHKPNMIITDLKMPIMTGFEMIKKIRAIDKNIPILITSADDESASLNPTIDLGINAYITKPIDKKLLFDSMEDNIL